MTAGSVRQLVMTTACPMWRPSWARRFAVAPARRLEVAPLRVGCCVWLIFSDWGFWRRLVERAVGERSERSPARPVGGGSGGSFLFGAGESVAEAPGLVAGVDDVRSVGDAGQRRPWRGGRRGRPWSTPRTGGWWSRSATLRSLRSEMTWKTSSAAPSGSARYPSSSRTTSSVRA